MYSPVTTDKDAVNNVYTNFPMQAMDITYSSRVERSHAKESMYMTLTMEIENSVISVISLSIYLQTSHNIRSAIVLSQFCV